MDLKKIEGYFDDRSDHEAYKMIEDGLKSGEITPDTLLPTSDMTLFQAAIHFGVVHLVELALEFEGSINFHHHTSHDDGCLSVADSLKFLPCMCDSIRFNRTLVDKLERRYCIEEKRKDPLSKPDPMFAGSGDGNPLVIACAFHMLKDGNSFSDPSSFTLPN